MSAVATPLATRLSHLSEYISVDCFWDANNDVAEDLATDTVAIAFDSGQMTAVEKVCRYVVVERDSDSDGVWLYFHGSIEELRTHLERGLEEESTIPWVLDLDTGEPITYTSTVIVGFPDLDCDDNVAV